MFGCMLCQGDICSGLGVVGCSTVMRGAGGGGGQLSRRLQILGKAAVRRAMSLKFRRSRKRKGRKDEGVLIHANFDL